MKTKIDFDFCKQSLKDCYKNALTKDVLDFWLKYGIDKENGGIYTGLDRDGSIIETDKSIWFQGRALWIFSTSYSMLASRGEKHPEYLEASLSLVNFIEKYATDKSDGRMYFRVTKDGRPVVKRLRYFFSETFAIIGFAAYAKATNNIEYAKKAFSLYENVLKIKDTKGILIPKFDETNSPSIGFGVPMILLNTLSELRSALAEKEKYCTEQMDILLNQIKKYFIRPELEAVIEQCNPDGSIAHNHIEGRQLNPGHAIEGAWFIMKEGILRNDNDLKQLGVKMLDWMWKRGWDEKFGGIIYFLDLDGKPCSEYWQDMKFWWPQCEAAIANLYAYYITNDIKYKNRFVLVHNYFHERFPDEQYGECFGYFHRDGSIATTIKGNMYKGPFHIPRMYLECIDLLEKIDN